MVPLAQDCSFASWTIREQVLSEQHVQNFGTAADSVRFHNQIVRPTGRMAWPGVMVQCEGGATCRFLTESAEPNGPNGQWSATPGLMANLSRSERLKRPCQAKLLQSLCTAAEWTPAQGVGPG